jgi:hypothetical protein
MDESEWPLCNGGEYLRGLTLVRRPWRESRPGWDHDHCDLCLTTFGDQRFPDALNEGYTTEDEYRWICPSCSETFRRHYGWQ